MRETAVSTSSRSAESAQAWLLVVALVAAAALITSLAGGFGTGALPIGARLFVFGATIGVNAAKWSLWAWLVSRTLPDRFGPLMIGGAAGALLLNLTLPAELELAFSMLGIEAQLPFWSVYASAVLIASAVYAMVLLVTRRRAAPAISPVGTVQKRAPLPPFLVGTGATDAQALIAIRAEDHYLRLHFRDGRTLLVLHRFGDALAQLGGEDGMEVRRGAWVRRDAVAAAERVGRRWQLRLIDGTSVRISASRVGAARAVGLLGRAGS